MQFLFPKAIMITCLSDLVAVGKPLDGAVVALATNTDILTDQSVFGDIEFATYGGYVHSTAVVWGAPHYQRDGSVQIFAGSKTFTPTDASASNAITYAVLLNGAGDTVLAVLHLSQPVTLGSPDDFVTINFPIMLAQTILEPADVIP
jgi:hypothetical protein